MSSCYRYVTVDALSTHWRHLSHVHCALPMQDPILALGCNNVICSVSRLKVIKVNHPGFSFLFILCYSTFLLLLLY